MKIYQTLKTALSNDNLAYAALANVLSPDYSQINPKRIVWRLLFAGCLMLGGVVAVFCAIAGVGRAAGSPEAEGFVVILFCAGSLVCLASLVHMVLNAAYAVVVQRILIEEKEVALQSQCEEINQAKNELRKVAAFAARVDAVQQENEKLQKTLHSLLANKLSATVQAINAKSKEADLAPAQHAPVRITRSA